MSAVAKKLELAVTVKGEIVTSNFAEFRRFVGDQLSYINYEPATDEDFGAAEQDVKMLKQVEKSLVEAKKIAIGKMESVNELFDQIDDMSDEARQNRLKLEKSIKSKKAEVKASILEVAYNGIIAANKGAEHRAGLEQAIKGKRNLESIQSAADEYVSATNDAISDCREVLNAHIQEYGKQLIPDSPSLELGDASHLTTVLALRVERARAEEERKKLQKSEQEEKAKQEARDKAEAEAQWDAEQAAINKERESKDNNEKVATVKMLRSGHQSPVSNNPTPDVAANPVLPEVVEATDYNEINLFAMKVKSTLMPLKSARCLLQNELNIEIAWVFSEEVGAAWRKMVSSLNEIKGGSN